MNAGGKVDKAALANERRGRTVNDLSSRLHRRAISTWTTRIRRLFNCCASDGRMAYRAIARELDVAENTVRARVRRMEESNAMRVVAVTDIEAAGYGMLLAIGVQVEGRSPEVVAREMAAIPEVFSVNVVVGAQDIEVLVVSRDQAALNELITDKLGRYCRRAASHACAGVGCAEEPTRLGAFPCGVSLTRQTWRLSSDCRGMQG